MTGRPARVAEDEARLRHRVRRLRAIVDASLLVNSELDLERLAQHVVAVAVRLIGAERGSLFLLDPGGRTLTSLVAQGLSAGAITIGLGEGIVGTVAASARALLLHDPYADPRFDQAVDRATGFKTRSLLTVPVRDREGTLVAVLQLLNKKRGGFGREDVTFLGELGATFALALTTAKLHREIVARERTAEEMKLAAQIQRTLQPEDLSVVPGLEVRALFRPSYEVGGDYFDCIPAADGKWWLVLADVSGKGVSSALIASNVQAYLWSRRNDGAPLEAVVAEGNELLHLLAKGRKYATLVLAEWTPGTRQLRWVNAGHPPAMLRRGGRVERLGATGTPMGLLPGMPYGSGSCTLAPGDILLSFTDGVSEAGEGTKAGDFGLDRVERIVRGLKAGADLNAAVASTVDKHLRGEPAGDDITLLCARVLDDPWGEP